MSNFITFRTLSGRQIMLPTHNYQTFADYKEVLQNKYHLPKDDVQFLYGLDIIPDNKPVSELKIERNEFILIHQSESYSRPLIRENQIKSYPRAANSGFKSFESHYKITDDEPILREKAHKQEVGISILEQDPADFLLMVQRLIEMGYEQNKVVTLLRKYKYSIEKVLDILIKGVEPEEAPKERVYDVSALKNYNFEEFSEFLQDLNNYEKHCLLQLLRAHTNIPPPELIQLYIACDKNMEAVDHNITG